MTGADAFGPLQAQATLATVDGLWGGYHDAGDYDKRIEHLRVVDDLVDLREMFPGRFDQDDLGLPESNNGVPDLLDEALWAIALYEKLQGPDGGVRAGVETTGYPGWDEMPEDDHNHAWYAYAPDPHSTYRFAGAAAKLARQILAYDPAKGSELLARAQSAWGWAEAHRDKPYSLAFLDAYAAAELFKTTGDPAYQTAYAAYAPKSLGDWDGDEAVPALWAWATSDGAGSAAAAALLIGRADSWVARGAKAGFRFVKHPYAPMGWGSGSIPKQADVLFRAHWLTGTQSYLQYGATTVDGTLGNNAMGLSYVTGVGAMAVERPLHTPSMADGIDAALPGLTVFGPAKMESSGGIQGAVIGAYEPAITSWPMAERFADVGFSPVVNEFTVHESIGPTALAFGYLAELDESGPEDPGADPGTDPGDPGDPGVDPGDPGDPGTDPGDPGTDPGDPGTDPGDPGTDLGDPGRDPGDPGMDPGDPGTAPGTDPNTTGSDPSSPGTSGPSGWVPPGGGAAPGDAATAPSASTDPGGCTSGGGGTSGATLLLLLSWLALSLQRRRGRLAASRRTPSVLSESPGLGGRPR